MKKCFILFSMVTTMAVAQTPSVTVVGEGIVHATPDMVNISISVEHEGDNPQNLRQRNAATVAKVLEILGKEKLPKDSYQTDYISLHKNYDYNTKTYNYLISQEIEIRLDDLTKYDTLMEKIFEAGVNRINRVTFDVKDRTKLLQEARVAAINDAKAKATLYATTLSQNIGKAVEIKENSSYSPMLLRSADMVGAVAPRKKAPSIAEGTLAVKAEITVSFELK